MVGVWWWWWWWWRWEPKLCNSHSNNRDCKDNLLQLAGHLEAGARGGIGVVIGIAITQRGVDVSTALLGAVTGQNGDRDHRTHEADIQHDSEESEEGHSAQAADEDCAQNTVQSTRTRQTLHGLDPGGNVQVMAGEDGEEV